MPRLRNSQSGAVVSCSDETAARLGSEWESAEKSTPKAAAKKSTSSKKSAPADD